MCKSRTLPGKVDVGPESAVRSSHFLVQLRPTSLHALRHLRLGAQEARMLASGSWCGGFQPACSCSSRLIANDLRMREFYLCICLFGVPVLLLRPRARDVNTPACAHDRSWGWFLIRLLLTLFPRITVATFQVSFRSGGTAVGSNGVSFEGVHSGLL